MTVRGSGYTKIFNIMAQVDLQALNLMPRILNDTLDKNNEIIINTVNGDATVLSPPLTNLVVAAAAIVTPTATTFNSARPVSVSNNNTSNNNIHGHTSYNHANPSGSNSTALINSTSSNERYKKCQYHCNSGRHRSHLNNNNHHTNLSPRDAGARYLQAAAAGTVNNQQSNCCGSSRNSTQDIVDGPPPPTNSSLINDRYLMLDLVEGSTLFKCIDVKANSEHVCKVSFNV